MAAKRKTKPAPKKRSTKRAPRAAPKKQPAPARRAAAKAPAAATPTKRRGTPRKPPMVGPAVTSALGDEAHDQAHDEVFETFKAFDRDGSGSIDRAELARLLEALGQSIDDEELSIAIEVIDANGSGRVSWAEFKAWWMDR